LRNCNEIRPLALSLAIDTRESDALRKLAILAILLAAATFLAGARLPQQVLAGLHGVGHGVRHLDLTRSLGPPDPGNRRLEQSVQVLGHQVSV
jgi:hypothetical protein